MLIVDYVCVADLERFELALRLNDGKDQVSLYLQQRDAH